MSTELSDESTHEEIVQKIDEVVAERDDAEKLAAASDKVTGTIEETNAEEETGEIAKEETDDSGDWLDDELKAEVAAYGIDEEELADFSSREELDKALRLFDRSALEKGRKALSEKGSEQEEKTDVDEKPETKAGYEVNLDKEAYDEDLIGEFTRMRDYYEDRVASLESRFAEVDAVAEEQRFDGIVDNLGHADLFGKSGKETKKETERREDLMVAVKAQQIGLEALGRPVDLNESLVNRVAKMVFAEELGKKERKNLTRKIAKQSDGRQGGSATKPHDTKGTLKDEMKQLYNELDGVGK